ncbi:MAG: hypothetical protein ACTSRP_19835 [Candidatus Helarchaeota archaeon]
MNKIQVNSKKKLIEHKNENSLKEKIREEVYSKGVIKLEELAVKLNSSEQEILDNINEKYHKIYDYLTGKRIACKHLACKHHLTREVPE